MAVGGDERRALAAARDVEVNWLIEDLTVWQPPRLALLSGMTVERAEQVTRVVSTADGSRTAIDTLVRARRAPHMRGKPTALEDGRIAFASFSK